MITKFTTSIRMIFFILSLVYLIGCQNKSNIYFTTRGINAAPDSLYIQLNDKPPYQYALGFCITGLCLDTIIANDTCYIYYTEGTPSMRSYRMVGRYKDGFKIKEHLTLKFFDLGKDKIVLREKYKKGLRHGTYTAYDTSGVQLYKTRFYKGTGYEKFFYPDGTLWHEGQLQRGVKVGIWRYYDEKGQILKEEDFGKINEK